MRALTLFTWGYDGWGNSTRELLKAFAAVERERGFGPPVFVDVRARRAVRAEGFRDDAFERRAGRKSYRWMPGLGNAAVLSGKGRMRLVTSDDAFELLGLAVAQAEQGRRVVFFCSCPSPGNAAKCHRRLVATEVLKAARRMRVAAEVVEWPGGEPAPRPTKLKIDDRAIQALRAGRWSVPLGAFMPPSELLSLPHGSLVELSAEHQKQLVSVSPACAKAGCWELPLFVHPAAASDTAGSLRSWASKFRRDDRLGGLRTR